MKQPKFERNQLLTPARDGHWIVSTPATYHITSDDVVECDGFTHEVYDKDGRKIADAKTRGLALQVIREGSTAETKRRRAKGQEQSHALGTQPNALTQENT